MDMEELVSCSICMDTFDENVRPRSLPCGHTFCTDCINNGIEGGLLSCAHCKKQHQASNGSDFPIIYAIEALVLKFRETQLGAIPKQDQMSDVQAGGSRGVNKRMQALIDNQKDQLKSLLKISNKTKKDITEYKSYIQDRRGKHRELREKIHILQQNNEAMIFQLEKEDKRVIDFLKEGEEYQKEAEKKLSKVDALTNATHIATASEELDKVQDDLEAWNEKCKMQLPCNETIRHSQKGIRKTTEALNLYEKDEDEVPFDFKNLLESDLSIMKRIKILEERIQPLILKSLQAKSESTMEILNRGQVFAVQRNGSHIRSGLISMSKGKTYLHCLRECLPPPDAFTIPEVEFTKNCSKSSYNSEWDRQEVETELLKLFKRPSNDEIVHWIDANIGNDANSSKFVRVLVTALVESQAMTSNASSSIRANEDFENKMKHRLQVVRKYVDGNDELELQCIYALQALCVAQQHPPGLLEKCFNAFYDSEVVSEEAFDEWVKYQDPEEQEGKGVCVAAVQNFMRWLKEADVEEAETY